ncbi:MAG: hypothetical protein PHH77_07410 [Victivallaceae bacterium]|nr:hypothetical protein [Victivallaceae bacterium]
MQEVKRRAGTLSPGSLSRRKIGIKPLLTVAIYTILAVDKAPAIKWDGQCSEKQKKCFVFQSAKGGKRKDLCNELIINSINGKLVINFDKTK